MVYLHRQLGCNMIELLTAGSILNSKTCTGVEIFHPLCDILIDTEIIENISIRLEI